MKKNFEIYKKIMFNELDTIILSKFNLILDKTDKRIYSIWKDNFNQIYLYIGKIEDLYYFLYWIFDKHQFIKFKNIDINQKNILDYFGDPNEKKTYKDYFDRLLEFRMLHYCYDSNEFFEKDYKTFRKNIINEK